MAETNAEPGKPKGRGDKPVRVPIEGLRFSRTSIATPASGGCFAQDLAKAALSTGINTTGEASGWTTSFGGETIFEDGQRERLAGCRRCGALCRLLLNQREPGPPSEDNPNLVISIAAAPVPNDWDIAANFADCQAGTLVVPEDIPGLVKPYKNGLKFPMDI